MIITGGSSGIGLAIAKQLVEYDAKILICARKKDKLLRIQQELNSGSRQNCEILQWDVSQKLDPSSDVSNHIKKFDPDVLVHSAGMSISKTFLDTTIDEYQSLMQTNYMGTIHVLKMISPLLEDKKSNIAVISSLAAKIGIYGYTAYSGSKFACEGFLQAFQDELIGKNTTCTIVYPADVDTPMFEQENKSKPHITKELSDAVLLSPEFVAKATLKGIAKEKKYVIPGFHSKLTNYHIQYFPKITQLYIRFMIKRLVKRQS